MSSIIGDPFGLVGHHVYTGGPLPDPADSYDYILGGNGLFLRAKNWAVDIMLPLWVGEVAMLPPIEPYFNLAFNRLSARFLDIVFCDARHHANQRMERLYYIVQEGGVFRLVIPPQTGSSGRVVEDPAYVGRHQRVFMEIHSHHTMGTAPSLTDDEDETLFRFYAIVGCFGSARSPEIRLRLGCSGHFFGLTADQLFESPGPFVDVFAPYSLAANPEDDSAFPLTELERAWWQL